MLHPIYHPLICHPKTPADYIETIEICCQVTPAGSLWLRYYIEVPEPMLVVANTQEPARTDDLWKTTCFEAFLAIGDEPEYLEFNFSAATLWAAYQFCEYREGRSNLALSAVPEIYLDMSNSHFALEATVQLPPQWQQGRFTIGVTVVAEEPSGTKSYWALDHKKAEPDFHDRSCFTLQLEAAEPS
jgi:hypothetical protein